jgi:triphosphoribosyl-dephospho-CoA synthetase
MNALQQTYAIKKSAYETMIASSNPNVNELKRLNTELSNLLTQMLTELAKVKEDAGHIEQYRNDLVRKLVAVQKDYTTLLSEREQLRTLRALREYEETKFNAAFFWYGLAFVIVTVVFFFILLWKGYKAPTIPTTTSSATTMPAFT